MEKGIRRQSERLLARTMERHLGQHLQHAVDRHDLLLHQRAWNGQWRGQVRRQCYGELRMQ